MIDNNFNLPGHFEKYFWDVSWEQLRIETGRYRNYIICRLADKGDLKVYRWLCTHFDIKELCAIIRRSRTVSHKTKLFWQNIGHHV